MFRLCLFSAVGFALLGGLSGCSSEQGASVANPVPANPEAAPDAKASKKANLAPATANTGVSATP